MKFQLDSSKPRIFPSTCFSIHRLEVFLLGLVRTGSERHLSFNHRDSSVSQATPIPPSESMRCSIATNGDT